MMLYLNILLPLLIVVDLVSYHQMEVVGQRKKRRHLARVCEAFLLNKKTPKQLSYKGNPEPVFDLLSERPNIYFGAK